MSRVTSIVIIVVIVIAAVAGVLAYQYLNTTTTTLEGPLNVVDWGGNLADAAQPAIKAFEQKYGVQVNLIIQAATSETPAKIAAQWPNPYADVIFTNEVAGNLMLKNGWLAPIPLSALSNWNNIPKNLQTVIATNGVPYYVPTLAFTWGFAYRSDLVSAPIHNFADILKPGYKFNMPSAVQGNGIFIVAAAYWKGGNETNIQPGFDAEKQIAQTGNVVSLSASSTAYDECLITGACTVSWGPSGQFASAAQNSSNIKMVTVLGDAKNPVVTNGVVVLKGPRVQLAYDFINILISTEMANQFSKISGYTVTNVDANISSALQSFNLVGSQVEQYGFHPNAVIMANQSGAWNNEFQTQIVPVIQQHLSSSG